MRILPFILLIVVSTAGFLSVGVSCKKKKKYCTEGGTCRSVLLAKDFFLFKEGSWWVYEEETSHQRDSQYVYQYTNTSGYDFDMRVHSTLEDYDYHYWPIYANGAIEECSESEPVSGRCIIIQKSKGKIGDFQGESNCFFINYKVGDWSYVMNVSYPESKITVSNIFPSYTNSVGIFSNTIEMTEVKTLTEKNQLTKHFYVQNIGLIRKELIDSNEVWNLVNYHIEQ
jgi:hypothetical protein